MNAAQRLARIATTFTLLLLCTGAGMPQVSAVYSPSGAVLPRVIADAAVDAGAARAEIGQERRTARLEVLRARAEPAMARVAVAPQPRVPLAPTQAACRTTWFCYPRMGIAGAIVPYDDCTGGTDVGTAIRSVVCVSDHYLAAHAYTQFGRIRGFRVGDLVFAYGRSYVVYGSFTQRACEPPAREPAPLSLQTSLTPAACGEVLVVQARLQ